LFLTCSKSCASVTLSSCSIVDCHAHRSKSTSRSNICLPSRSSCIMVN